ncbi:unnamed protein product [Discula destructiva]
MASAATRGDGSIRNDSDDVVPSQKALTIEERCLSAALICLEGHYTDNPPMGPLTHEKVVRLVSTSLEKTHASKDVRESLSRNVAIWIWITRIFAAAIPNLTTRSVGPLASLNDPDKGVTPQESTALIIKNYQGLKDDLQILNKLMHIARNMLVTSEPEVPQDISAAVHFDQMVYQTIILCVNVTSKGYDGETLDDPSRLRLNEITDLYKKIMVTALQQAHNWTAKNDRNKMAFWFDVLFDEDASLDDPQDGMGDGLGFRVDVAKTEVQNWLERNSTMCENARQLLRKYVADEARTKRPPGPLAPIHPLAWNWLPEGSVKVRVDDLKNLQRSESQPAPNDEADKFEQDRRYGRVSREVDIWWEKAKDPNHDAMGPVPSVEFAQRRTETCKVNLVERYTQQYRSDDQDRPDSAQDEGQETEYADEGENPVPEEYSEEYVDDMAEDEDVDDDESYGEGPMTGLLTEVPNILDPKQIEALHMIIKSNILCAAGSGLTAAGENLQQTRCKMFLALDCGKSLLREMLVFIAVWDQEPSSTIFQITSQIVEAIHSCELIPYAWNNLRIPKDIVSPAQTILLRLINHMFKSRIKTTAADETQEPLQAVKLVHNFFSHFRSRIVPECVALMRLQADIKKNQMDPADFPVDNWDMERAKDGLVQFLEFLKTVSEDFEMRGRLIEWEAMYDLIMLLQSLEDGVAKKPLVDPPSRSQHRPMEPSNNGLYDANAPPPPPPPHPNIRETPAAHLFPWAGTKGSILEIISTLLQPPPGRTSPGNPTVQNQIVRNNGIVALLNCCTYDDHNRFARERVQLCLKWLMDGSDAANKFLRELVAQSPNPNAAAAQGQTTNLRIDGIQGEVQVQVRPASNEPAMQSNGRVAAVPPVPGRATNIPPPPPAMPTTSAAAGSSIGNIAALAGGANNSPRKNIEHYMQAIDWAQQQMPARTRTDELLSDIINLADEAARLALGENAEETEDEDFMYCVMKLTERLKKEGIDINLRDALGVDTDPKLRNLRGKL